MKKHVSGMALVMALLALMGSCPASSFGAAPRAKVAKAGKARGRVPANYAKLDLTEDQKTKIYNVQAKYKEQIDALNLQLKDLRAKEMQEITEVLTADQKTKLQEFEEAAKKLKAENAAKKKAEAKEPKKADETPAKTDEKPAEKK